MTKHPAIQGHSFRKIGEKIVWFLLFTIVLSLFPYPNRYFRAVNKTEGIFQPLSTDIVPSPPPYPVNTNHIPPPLLTSEGVYIKDIDSGAILYTKNETVRFPSASTTKIMTALVALEEFKPDDVLTVKFVEKEGRTMGLTEGEKMIFEYLLDGALIHSANDAAYAIAQNYPQGVEAFVEAMNKKSKDLGLSDTHFTNPIGFDHPENYTTAKDLTIQAEVALANTTFAKTVGIRSITVADTSYSRFHTLTNVNELLGKIPGVSGVKTGFTQNGGEILVSEVRKNGRNVLIVLLRSQDRFGETEKLIQWIFDSFTWKTIDEIIPANQEGSLEDMQQNYYPL
ncbi:D-alanyl-D-alanine carboxypeptidase [Candidatus Gottesmanbacteria bacterium]|nr:D-alanyl-D-alanine carboxypeptidase [Candidatus Gottesmanbacteria bacterium]